MTVPKRKLFISYSHKDARWLAPIREQLAVLEAEGTIEIFADSLIDAGDIWYAKLEQEMLQSDVALLLISASFLSSHFIRTEELPRLLNKHKTGKVLLYPLLLRDCPWQEVSWLSAYQMRPRGARPVLSFKGADRDKCLADVAREIASRLRSGDDFHAKLEIDEKTKVPTNMISGNKVWTAKIMLDPFTPMPSPGDGTWRTRVFLESMGPGPEVQLPTDTGSEVTEKSIWHDGSLQYEFQVEVPTESVSPGIYQTVAVVEYIGSSGAIPPLSYVAEGPVVNVSK